MRSQAAVSGRMRTAGVVAATQLRKTVTQLRATDRPTAFSILLLFVPVQTLYQYYRIETICRYMYMG